MKNEKVKQLFRQADTEFDRAQRELYQPSHDVVTYAVCINARSSLYRFMQCLYLLYSGDDVTEVDDSLTLLELVERCRKFDKKLESLNFSKMNCINRDVRQEHEEDVYFCDDTCMVQECTDYAGMVRELVLEKGRDILVS
jgi:hypothetical protein